MTDGNLCSKGGCACAALSGDFGDIRFQPMCDGFLPDCQERIGGMSKQASWESVRDKGRAILDNGGVEIVEETPTQVTAYVMSGVVEGMYPVYDGGPYEVILSKKSWENKGNVGGWVQGFLCDCKWGFYHSGQPGSGWQGRFCSHAYATLLAANARARGDFFRDKAASVSDPYVWFHVEGGVMDKSAGVDFEWYRDGNVWHCYLGNGCSGEVYEPDERGADWFFYVYDKVVDGDIEPSLEEAKSACESFYLEGRWRGASKTASDWELYEENMTPELRYDVLDPDEILDMYGAYKDESYRKVEGGMLGVVTHHVGMVDDWWSWDTYAGYYSYGIDCGMCRSKEEGMAMCEKSFADPGFTVYASKRVAFAPQHSNNVMDWIDDLELSDFETTPTRGEDSYELHRDGVDLYITCINYGLWMPQLGWDSDPNIGLVKSPDDFDNPYDALEELVDMVYVEYSKYGLPHSASKVAWRDWVVSPDETHASNKWTDSDWVDYYGYAEDTGYWEISLGGGVGMVLCQGEAKGLWSAIAECDAHARRSGYTASHNSAASSMRGAAHVGYDWRYDADGYYKLVMDDSIDLRGGAWVDVDGDWLTYVDTTIIVLSYDFDENSWSVGAYDEGHYDSRIFDSYPPNYFASAEDAVDWLNGHINWIGDFRIPKLSFSMAAVRRLDYDDDVVVVRNPDGGIDYKGIFDYCPYKYDFDHGHWRFDGEKYEDQDHPGYTLEVIAGRGKTAGHAIEFARFAGDNVVFFDDWAFRVNDGDINAPWHLVNGKRYVFGDDDEPEMFDILRNGLEEPDEGCLLDFINHYLIPDWEEVYGWRLGSKTAEDYYRAGIDGTDYYLEATWNNIKLCSEIDGSDQYSAYEIIQDAYAYNQYELTGKIMRIIGPENDDDDWFYELQESIWNAVGECLEWEQGAYLGWEDDVYASKDAKKVVSGDGYVGEQFFFEGVMNEIIDVKYEEYDDEEEPTYKIIDENGDIWFATNTDLETMRYHGASMSVEGSVGYDMDGNELRIGDAVYKSDEDAWYEIKDVDKFGVVELHDLNTWDVTRYVDKEELGLYTLNGPSSAVISSVKNATRSKQAKAIYRIRAHYSDGWEAPLSVQWNGWEDTLQLLNGSYVIYELYAADISDLEMDIDDIVDAMRSAADDEDITINEDFSELVYKVEDVLSSSRRYAGKSASVKNATRKFTYAEMKELEDEIEGRELHNYDRFKDGGISYRGGF